VQQTGVLWIFNRPSNIIGFNTFPIDKEGAQVDTVEIVGFEVSKGTNIFGNFGYPKKQDANFSYHWIGTAMLKGKCTY